MTFLSKFDATCSKCRRPIIAKRHYITWAPDQRGRPEHYNCADPCARPPEPTQAPASPRADDPQQSPAQSPAPISAQVPAAPMRSAPVFPLPLVEKYRPSAVADFIGIAEAKSVFAGLLKNPRPCALLLVGPPGVGKTTLAMAFAKQLRAGLIHHASAKLTVDAVAQTVESTQYYPESGDWWVVICDEADRMSPQAQTALLSCLDSCNTLFPTFGGGFEEAKPLPVIWIFTCNGEGEKGTEPPKTLEARFLSRCLRVKFPPINGELPAFLAHVWCCENRGSSEPTPLAQLDTIAQDAKGNVRDALQALELTLLTD